jgi:hypothetical protein
MKVKRIIILTFLFSAISFGQTNFNFTLEKRDTSVEIRRIIISLKSDSENIFNYDYYENESISSNYIINKGEYKFTIAYADENNESQVFRYTFNVIGDEKRVDLKLLFSVKEKEFLNDPLSKEKKNISCFISFEKYYKNSYDIFLIPVNELNIGDGIYYKIVNNSDKPIYGYYAPFLFYGELYLKDDNQYKLFTRGSIDLNVSNINEPLMPKDTTYTFIPHFYNNKGGVSYLLNKTGSYHYIVYYSLEKASFGYSFYQTIDEIEYWLRENKLYKLDYDFIVK